MRLRTTGLLCVSILALACGARGGSASSTAGPIDESTSSSTGASGAQDARATLGPRGGTLSLANGARLQVPPNTLEQNVAIDFRVGAVGRAFGDAERQRPLGPTLAVEPSVRAVNGGHFEVSIPEQRIPSGFSRDDLAFAMEEEVDPGDRMGDTIATQTHWQFYRVSVEGGRFIARVDGFPGNRVQFGVAR